MKCENHPDRIASQSCQKCRMPLCDQCTLYMDNGSVLCDRCSLLAILEQQHQESQEKLVAKKEYRLRILEKRKRQDFIRKTVLYTFVLIVAFVSLRAFHLLNKPRNEEINLSEHNDVMLYILDQAINDYIQENSGELPNRLGDLIGRYLPAEKVGRHILARFSYEKKIPPFYRLRLNRNIEDPMAGMVFTHEGFDFE
jgi:hypothetical protein